MITEGDNVKLGGYDEERMLEALGGKDNIVSLDNCITRLRWFVRYMSIVDSDE